MKHFRRIETGRWRGFARIAPGSYVGDGGQLHIVIDELLVENGYDDTPANREKLTAAARAYFGAALPRAKLTIVE